MAMKAFLRGMAFAPMILIGLLIATAAAPLVPAFGQEVGKAVTAEPKGVVYLAPLFDSVLPYAIELFMAAILALAGWLVKLFRDKTKIDLSAGLAAIEARHRDALQSAIKTAVGSLIAKQGPMSIDVKSDALAGIIRYLRDSVPDALAHFNPSNDVIAKIANAKALEITAATAPTVVATINSAEPPK